MSLSPEQFAREYGRYGCRKLADIGGGYEVWITGWGATLTVRPQRHNGNYDQADCNRLALMINRTIPVEWRTAAEVSRLRDSIDALSDEIRQLRQEIRGKRSGD